MQALALYVALLIDISYKSYEAIQASVLELAEVWESRDEFPKQASQSGAGYSRALMGSGLCRVKKKIASLLVQAEMPTVLVNH